MDQDPRIFKWLFQFGDVLLVLVKTYASDMFVVSSLLSSNVHQNFSSLVVLELVC